MSYYWSENGDRISSPPIPISRNNPIVSIKYRSANIPKKAKFAFISMLPSPGGVAVGRFICPLDSRPMTVNWTTGTSVLSYNPFSSARTQDTTNTLNILFDYNAINIPNQSAAPGAVYFVTDGGFRPIGEYRATPTQSRATTPNGLAYIPLPQTMYLHIFFAESIGPNYTAGGNVGFLPYDYLYIGNYNVGNCLGLSAYGIDVGTTCDQILGSKQSGQGFCAKNPDSQLCKCINAPVTKPTDEVYKAIQDAQKGLQVQTPYYCFLEPCLGGESGVYTKYSSQSCPPIQVCKTVIEAGKNGSVNIKNSKIYQECMKNNPPSPPGPSPTPTPTPTPSPSPPSHRKWLIYGAIAVGILLFILLVTVGSIVIF